MPDSAKALPVGSHNDLMPDSAKALPETMTISKSVGSEARGQRFNLHILSDELQPFITEHCCSLAHGILDTTNHELTLGMQMRHNNCIGCQQRQSAILQFD